MPHPVTAKDAKFFKHARESFDCAMVLNHPALRENFEESGMHDFLDGFERWNSGRDYFSFRPIPESLKHLPFYSNSDAHSPKSLAKGYNLVSEYIRSETDLIKFLQSHEPPKAYFPSID